MVKAEITFWKNKKSTIRNKTTHKPRSFHWVYVKYFHESLFVIRLSRYKIIWL